MTKFEFVRETGSDGFVTYYTTRDGVFVSGSMSYKEELAKDIFTNLLNGGDPKKKEVLETKEVEL